jgi:hypothetical protein
LLALLLVGLSLLGREPLAERKIIEAYVKGERMKGYQTVLWRIRQIGLKAIIDGCERDLTLLKRLAQREISHTN